MEYLGAAIIGTTDAQSFVTAFTGVLTDNLPAILLVFGTVFGVNWAFRHFGKSTKGRL